MNTTQPSAPNSDQETLRQFVSSEMERYSNLRDHKETMAYAGLALYMGAAGSALVSENWPPVWGGHSKLLAVIAITLLWVVVRLYLRYQLRRRRWAQLRVAGCEWLLVSWLPRAPKQEDPKEKLAASGKQAPLWVHMVDFLWPLKRGVGALDRSMNVYPPELERAWTDAERHGTDVLKHEWLIQAALWLLYAAWLAKTVVRVNAG